MATIHKKVWPEHFEKIISGKKKFELRLADFEINESDILVLEEWDKEKKEYTGRKIEVIATYILKTKGQTFWPQKEVDKYGFQIIQFELKKIIMDTQKKTTETYDKIASSYSSSHFAHFWIEEFDFYKSIIDGKKVIDLGCGAGRDAAVFVENGFDYTGIDASEGMLKVASERVPKGKFQQMDFSKTIFQDGEFDGFWTAASFLHIPKKDVVGVLQEAKRITKNCGVGFISVKEKNGIDEGMIDENKYGGISRYFSFYTQDEFKNLLEQNGFSVLKMTTHTENDEQKTNWLCYFVKVTK